MTTASTARTHMPAENPCDWIDVGSSPRLTATEHRNPMEQSTRMGIPLIPMGPCRPPSVEYVGIWHARPPQPSPAPLPGRIYRCYGLGMQADEPPLPFSLFKALTKRKHAESELWPREGTKSCLPAITAPLMAGLERRPVRCGGDASSRHPEKKIHGEGHAQARHLYPPALHGTLHNHIYYIASPASAYHTYPAVLAYVCCPHEFGIGEGSW